MTTRREMLAGITAAAVAAPFTGAAVAARQPNRSAWNAAMAVYDKAKADYARAAEQWDRTAEAYKELVGRSPHVPRGPDSGYDEEAARQCGFHQINQTIDDWGERAADAADPLIEMPAPDREALLWKVEYLWSDDLGASYCDAWMEVVMADFRRLLSAGRA